MDSEFPYYERVRGDSERPRFASVRDYSAISEAGRRLIGRPPRRIRKVLIRERIATRVPSCRVLRDTGIALAQQVLFSASNTAHTTAVIAAAEAQENPPELLAELRRVQQHLIDVLDTVNRSSADLFAAQRASELLDSADRTAFRDLRARERRDNQEQARVLNRTWGSPFPSPPPIVPFEERSAYPN